MYATVHGPTWNRPMTRQLEVMLGSQQAGHLVETGPGGWAFVYADTGPDGAEALPHPVSLALPRFRQTHHGDAVRAVFANLLPDGELRRRLAQSLGLSESNELGLLARLAGDCAGALRLHVPGFASGQVGALRQLSADELRNAMAVLPMHPLLAEADGLRVSLSGEFDKLPVRLQDGQVALVLGDALSTHILKTARPGLRESIWNEAFVMALAEDCGLPVAETEILHGQVSILCVTRVDRRAGENPAAVHMEDFCQIAGLPASAKYQREGGLRLQDIVTLVRRCSVRPALDIRALVRWVLFSFLTGFGAGHAKQLAMIYGPRGPQLAPFFGLWSTHVYHEMNARLGFTIGGEDRPDWLTAARWAQFAVDAGLKPKYVHDELRAMAAELPARAAAQAEQFQRRNGFAEILRPIRVLVEQRARQAVVSLEAESAPAGQRGRGRPSAAVNDVSR